jgi:hypothetical protein
VPETLADGRVRLAYAFDDALELDDFDHDLDEPGETARIDGGSLVLTGAVQVTSRLALDAPLSLRMKIRVPVDPDPEKDPRVALHLSGAEAQATSKSTGELALAGTADARSLTGAEWPRNRLFELELVHDGANLSARIDGLTSAQIDARALPGGALGIEVRSARPVYVAELELIGRLGAGNEERARAAHVRRVVAALGL